jgi:hypothetical protein
VIVIVILQKNLDLINESLSATQFHHSNCLVIGYCLPVLLLLPLLLLPVLLGASDLISLSIRDHMLPPTFTGRLLRDDFASSAFWNASDDVQPTNPRVPKTPVKISTFLIGCWLILAQENEFEQSHNAFRTTQQNRRDLCKWTSFFICIFVALPCTGYTLTIRMKITIG